VFRQLGNNETSVKPYCSSIENDFCFFEHIKFLLFPKGFILRVDTTTDKLTLIVFIFQMYGLRIKMNTYSA